MDVLLVLVLSQCVGGFLGSQAALSQWLEPQIAQWVWGAELLAMVALRYSQNTYASLAKSLQQEWQYLQRAVPDCGVAFELVEEAIRLVFIPALLQATEAECQRKLTTISVPKAGLGLLDQNPVGPRLLAHCVRGLRLMPTCTGAMQASSPGWPRRRGRRPMSKSLPSSRPPPTLLPSARCSVPRRLGRSSPPCPIASMPQSSQWTSSKTAFSCNLDSLRLASLTYAMTVVIASC
jgi:hypothetical protein